LAQCGAGWWGGCRWRRGQDTTRADVLRHVCREMKKDLFLDLLDMIQ
jgi:hypothetical protein